MLHLNIRSLLPKIYIFKVWVAQYKSDVVTPSETMLLNNVCDDEIKVDTLSLYIAEVEEVWQYTSLHTFLQNLLFLK